MPAAASCKRALCSQQTAIFRGPRGRPKAGRVLSIVKGPARILCSQIEIKMAEAERYTVTSGGVPQSWSCAAVTLAGTDKCMIDVSRKHRAETSDAERGATCGGESEVSMVEVVSFVVKIWGVMIIPVGNLSRLL